MKDLLGDEVAERYTPQTRTRRTDPGTSFAAAAGVMPKLRKLQEQVYACHKQNPQGMTDLDLEAKMQGHGLSTVRTRRAELVQLGLLRDSGERKLQDGSKRIVWVVV